MSKIIASAAIRGAYKIAEQAEEILSKAIKEKGKDCPVEFPNTGYYMPIIYSMTGKSVETLADFEEVLKEVKDLLPPHVDEDIWVLHAFQKKSKTGIKTPKQDIDLVKERLKRLKEMLI